VIGKRNHITGNIYPKEVEGINGHMYGAHIFHTSNKEVGSTSISFVSLTDS
jgi:UDP-galactopyranose mutase